MDWTLNNRERCKRTSSKECVSILYCSLKFLVSSDLVISTVLTFKLLNTNKDKMSHLFQTFQ